jgi:ribosomal protein S18 acetylase RimI-like enzyme
MYKIRPALLEDLDAVVDLLYRTVDLHPAYISHSEIQMGVGNSTGSLEPSARDIWIRSVSSAIISPTSAVFVAQRPEGIVGFAIAEIASTSIGVRYGTLTDLGVDPFRRATGVGKALFDRAVEWLTASNVAMIFLESGINNDSAHGFFEKLGFRPISKVFIRETQIALEDD